MVAAQDDGAQRKLAHTLLLELMSCVHPSHLVQPYHIPWIVYLDYDCLC